MSRKLVEVKEYFVDGVKEVVINDGISVKNNGDVKVIKDLHVDGAITSAPTLKTQFIIGSETKAGSVTCNEIVVRDGIVYYHIHAVKDASVNETYTTNLFQFPVGARPEYHHGFVIIKQSAIGALAGMTNDTEGHCNFYGWTKLLEQEYDFSGCFILPTDEEVALAAQISKA